LLGKEVPGTGSLSHQPLQMRSAYVLKPGQFTNWVPDFRAALDVILYDTHSRLRCLHAYPLCSAEEITGLDQQNRSLLSLTTRSTEGSLTEKQATRESPLDRGEPIREADLYALPNSTFPSDHLALIADFQIPLDSNNMQT
uniref:Endo/exonuclease/phosphatase domain-containing protein n=1 Tax=Echinostoma caproni TaxID=27848 RepID=A0A183AKD7_9TREM